MTTKKARSSVVTIAGKDVECLMLPSGEFRIAVSQVWALLQLSTIPSNATKDVKALLSRESHYSSTEKVVSDIHSQAVNTITLEQFSFVLVAAAKKGNTWATGKQWTSSSRSTSQRITWVCRPSKSRL